MGKIITGAQIRAARAFLQWSREHLADTAGVGESTVRAVEACDDDPHISGGLDFTLEYRSRTRNDALAKIIGTLRNNGIVFLPDQGVRWVR